MSRSFSMQVQAAAELFRKICELDEDPRADMDRKEQLIDMFNELPRDAQREGIEAYEASR